MIDTEITAFDRDMAIDTMTYNDLCVMLETVVSTRDSLEQQLTNNSIQKVCVESFIGNMLPEYTSSVDVSDVITSMNESIGSVMKKMVDAIINMFKRIVGMIKTFFKRIFRKGREQRSLFIQNKHATTLANLCKAAGVPEHEVPTGSFPIKTELLTKAVNLFGDITGTPGTIAPGDVARDLASDKEPNSFYIVASDLPKLISNSKKYKDHDVSFVAFDSPDEVSYPSAIYIVDNTKSIDVPKDVSMSIKGYWNTYYYGVASILTYINSSATMLDRTFKELSGLKAKYINELLDTIVDDIKDFDNRIPVDNMGLYSDIVNGNRDQLNLFTPIMRVVRFKKEPSMKELAERSRNISNTCDSLIKHYEKLKNYVNVDTISKELLTRALDMVGSFTSVIGKVLKEVVILNKFTTYVHRGFVPLDLIKE